MCDSNIYKLSIDGIKVGPKVVGVPVANAELVRTFPCWLEVRTLQKRLRVKRGEDQEASRRVVSLASYYYHYTVDISHAPWIRLSLSLSALHACVCGFVMGDSIRDCTDPDPDPDRDPNRLGCAKNIEFVLQQSPWSPSVD